MNIVFLTNPIAGGWHPADLDTFLGGNEECLTHLARALARAGCYVEVYTTLRGDPFTESPGVTWHQRDTFDPTERRDVFVSWKDREVWEHDVAGHIKLHASQDVEAALPLDRIHSVLTLGSYHQERLPWLPLDRSLRVPLGIDPNLYWRSEQKDALALYATSPDRGLAVLLGDWPRIRERHERSFDLLITYDWSRLATMSGPNGAAYAQYLSQLSYQPGIRRRTFSQADMAEQFRRAKFYIHPLPNPDADLFGFGALKAQECGATLVLPDTLDNGFRDTVRSWIPYSAFVKGETHPFANERFSQPALSWDEVVEDYWMPIFRRLG